MILVTMFLPTFNASHVNLVWMYTAVIGRLVPFQLFRDQLESRQNAPP